jgi:hypothetical protein
MISSPYTNEMVNYGRAGYGGGYGDFGGGGGAWLLLLALLGRNGFGFDGHGNKNHDGHGWPHNACGDPCTRAQLQELMTKADLGATERAEILKEIEVRWGDLKAHVSDRDAQTRESINRSLFDMRLADGVEARQLDGKLCKIENSIIAGNYALSRQISEDGQATRALINAGEKAALERRITQLEIENNRHHDDHRSRESEIRVTQTVNQAQAQNQGQQQQQQIVDLLRDFGHRLGRFEAQISIGNQLAAQSARATQDIVNLGTMTSSGGLSANQANTAVR